MATENESLICPITLELFRDPVLAQDGHTYERQAIENWIRQNGTSPLTRQELSLEHLYPNHLVRKLIVDFEKALERKNYQFILDVDVKKKKGRPLFQTYGKTIYHAEWLGTNCPQPDIILLKIDGARALKEASFYVNLTRHPHVVRTFALVLDKTTDDENNSAMLLQEHATEGSLHELLRERRKALDEKILIEIFMQIIDAMIFLAYNHIVHGDLACRNVLIFRFDEIDPKNNIVKVTDFGLSRQNALYSKTLGSGQTALDIVPIRYAAPEIFTENSKQENYTEKSDVYSMGVLMWEAYSRGALPWAKIEKDADVIRNVINSVYLPKPTNCTEKYWNAILKTWSKLPVDRPTFEQLKRLLIEQSVLPVAELFEQLRINQATLPAEPVESRNQQLLSETPVSSIRSLQNENQANTNAQPVIRENTTINQENQTTTERINRDVVPTDNNQTLPISKFPPSNGEKRSYLFKVLVLGDFDSGKTILVKRYVHNFYSESYRATIGVDFALKIVNYDDDTVIRLQLWDIAGQERFGNMTRVYHKEAVGCFIVFDVTKEWTFEAVTKWKTDLDNKVQLPDGSPVPCVLLANKCDLVKEGLVNNAQQMDEFCKEKGFAKWFETSAKENINIEASSKFLISEIMKHTEQLQPHTAADPRKNTLTVQNVPSKPAGKKCCGGGGNDDGNDDRK